MPDENRNTPILIKELCLKNFLSFGDKGDKDKKVELRSLNVIIGPNGSGKSNFIEAIDLIRSTPITSESSNLLAAIRDGGGVRDWLWKGTEPPPCAAIDAVFENREGSSPLRYVLGFSEVGQRFEIQDERIENEKPSDEHSGPYIYYTFEQGHGVLNFSDPEKRRSLQREEINPTASIHPMRTTSPWCSTTLAVSSRSRNGFLQPCRSCTRVSMISAFTSRGARFRYSCTRAITPYPPPGFRTARCAICVC